MSYKVGQILSNNVSNYYTDRQIDKMDLISDIETKNDIIEVYFKDKKISYNFVVDNHYYIKLKIKRFINSDQKITLKLINDNESSSDVSQYIDNFTIFQNNNNGNEYATIEAIVSPNTTYTHLAVILTRQYEDFTVQQSNSSVVIENRLGREIEITGFQIFQFSNLIPNLMGSDQKLTLTKFGIQGPPGMLMCINGEGIRIGPSRIYEIRNGYKINFLGIVIRNSSDISGSLGRDSFIIDYQYKDTITVENQEEGE